MVSSKKIGPDAMTANSFPARTDDLASLAVRVTRIGAFPGHRIYLIFDARFPLSVTGNADLLIAGRNQKFIFAAGICNGKQSYGSLNSIEQIIDALSRYVLCRSKIDV
jgi:hypothetical protein